MVAKKIKAKRMTWRSHGMVVNVPMRLVDDAPRDVPTPEAIAAETLLRYIAYGQQRGRAHPKTRAFKPGRLYGVFRGDVLVNWGVGRNAKRWADRAAANCWNGELRAQFLGTF